MAGRIAEDTCEDLAGERKDATKDVYLLLKGVNFGKRRKLYTVAKVGLIEWSDTRFSLLSGDLSLKDSVPVRPRAGEQK